MATAVSWSPGACKTCYETKKITYVSFSLHKKDTVSRWRLAIIILSNMIGFSYREEEEGPYYIFVVSDMAMMAEDSAIIATVHAGLVNSGIKFCICGVHWISCGRIWQARCYRRTDPIQEGGNWGARGIRKWRWLHEQCNATRLVRPLPGILLFLAQLRGGYNHCFTAAKCCVLSCRSVVEGLRCGRWWSGPRAFFGPERRESVVEAGVCTRRAIVTRSRFRATRARISVNRQ